MLSHALRALVVLIFSVAGNCALAHEFWILPDRFAAAPGSTVNLSLFVGQDFTGEQVGISAPLVAAFRHYAAGSVSDLRRQAPVDAAVGSVAVPLARAGTHLLAIDTHPSAIELPAEKFNEYLKLEGLQGVMQSRERAGASASPGRERYRRNIKTLVQAGEPADSTFSRRTGQRLEIVPLQDPARVRADSPAAFQVFFDARPLSGALVKFWNRSGGELSALGRRTDAQGKVGMALPVPGVWMVSVVHMIPVRDSQEFDWDSYWGNLTFSLRPERR